MGAADRYEIRNNGDMNVSLISVLDRKRVYRNFRPYRSSDTEYTGNGLPRVISIDPRTLPRILRIEGLIPFTISAILLGFAVTWREVGVFRC